MLVRACVLACCAGLASALSVAAAHAATRRWVNQVVVGERLCPWASPAALRIVVVGSGASGSDACSSGARDSGADGDHTAYRVLSEEAARLRSAGDAGAPQPRHTTLVVFSDAAHSLDAAAFCRLASAAGKRLGPEIDLLAFHPTRCDAGPGCVATDASDAGHYAVRSPLPTLQLLRSADLTATRAEYAAGRVPGAAAARARHPQTPGALALLLENKRRLRTIGAGALQRVLDDCVQQQEEGWQGGATCGRHGTAS